MSLDWRLDGTGVDVDVMAKRRSLSRKEMETPFSGTLVEYGILHLNFTCQLWGCA